MQMIFDPAMHVGTGQLLLAPQQTAGCGTFGNATNPN